MATTWRNLDQQMKRSRARPVPTTKSVCAKEVRQVACQDRLRSALWDAIKDYSWSANVKQIDVGRHQVRLACASAVDAYNADRAQVEYMPRFAQETGIHGLRVRTRVAAA